MPDPTPSAPDAAHATADRLAGALIESGMARMPARVLAAAMIDEDGRMTAAEIADFLHVSAGSVSAAVRMLTKLGMLRRERDRGSTRDVFVVDDDTWPEATRRYDQVYAPIKNALAAAGHILGRDHPAASRLRISHEFLTFVEHEFASMPERWQARRRELGL